MSEIKNTFTQGKMNQDLDERIVPNGQYIDAMNIKVTSSDDASVGVVQNILGNYRVEDIIPPDSGYVCIATIADEKNNKLYWFVTQEPSSTHAILEHNLTSGKNKIVLVDKKNDTLKFTQNIITGINIIDNLLFWTDNYSEPKKINIDDCIKGTAESNPTVTNLDNALHTRLVVNGDDQGDMSEKNITVIRKSPKQPPTITINKPTDKNAQKLFEQVFPRFSFRYKYEDGQYSSFGPFTQVVFNPVYVENEYGRDDAYSTKESHNSAMINQIKSIEISNFISTSTPKDVTQVEILYKEDGSSVVFSIKTIDYNDIAWNNNTYTLESETIFAAIPSNQFLRPWDNVPKKALAQEITGNRLVYANYTQGYDLFSEEGFKVGNKISASFDLRNDKNFNFSNGGVPSLKTQRNYQVGFIWGDEHGRETPVFTSEEAGVNIPWYNDTHELLASKSLFLKANLATFIPSWADYYKFYVKETSGDYYNLLMEKAYPQSHMNVFDFEEDRVWLAFPSADRNKVTEDDYLIIKKQLIGNHEQIPLKNKFKILDIQNEAPDAIKFEYTTLGSASQTSGGVAQDYLTDSLFVGLDFIINKAVDMLHIKKSEWLNSLNGVSLTKTTSNLMAIEALGAEVEEIQNNLYVYWRDIVANTESERYKVIDVAEDLSGNYRIKLSKNIELFDAELAEGGSSSTLNSNIKFFIDKKTKKDVDEYSGKFFTQIVYKPPTSPEEFDASAPTIVTGRAKSNWFYDTTIAPNTAPIDANGIMNINVDIGQADPPTQTSSTFLTGSGSTTQLGEWVSLVAQLNEAGVSQRGFFIDNMYMVAGQIFNDSTTSTSAKLSGKTWIDWLEGPADIIPTWGEFDSGGYGWKDGGFPFPLQASYSPRPFSRFGDETFKDVTKTMNGLEGFLTTKSEHVANTIGNLGPVDGYRRWKRAGNVQFPLAGLGDDTYGVSESSPNGISGVQPNISGRYFIHLSFLAPGEDLHDGDWQSNPFVSAKLFGENSPGNHMQAIWGGGIFTGSGEILEMEGNYDEFDVAQAHVPAPGFGQGYDNRFDYATKNENQWNPAWPPVLDNDGNLDSKIQDFLDNIKNGGRFHFSSDPSEIFTIKGTPKEKRIYNHTSWVAQYKWDGNGNINTVEPSVSNNGLVLCENSVDEAASKWLADISDEDTFSLNTDSLQNKITDFGKAHNRRVVYIFEVDKNPGNFPAVISGGAQDFDCDSQLNITFVSSSPNTLLKDLIKGPAIWETEAKPGENLDLYYEASQAIPLHLTDETNELFAPEGSRVEILIPDARFGELEVDTDIFLESWNSNNEITLSGTGFNRRDSDSNAIVYENVQIRFFRLDGSYTTTRIIIEGDNPANYVQNLILDTTLDAAMEQGLGYFNCYSFGNGVESNRVRDDFNAPSISKGVKASLVLNQEYKEESRKNGLIYSGIYNSTSGVNNLNQFIQAENITKDLNPTYGGIQKLFQRRISLVAFCEDKVVSITSNKDALFNADGNSQLVSTNNVLGDATPFVGDYGISKNPESFAKESYRAYFTDKQRGAVLRLSMDGITAISDSGMDDYFRNNLKLSGEILGSYDAYSKNYNVTFKNYKPEENIIANNLLSGTGTSLNLNLTPSEEIIDGDVTNYNPLVPASIDITTSIYNNDIIDVETTITNYDEIAIGDLLDQTYTITTTTVSNTGFTTDNANPSFYFGSYSDDSKPNPFHPGQDDFKIKSYSVVPGNFQANYDSFQYPTHDDPNITDTGQESTSTSFYENSSYFYSSQDVFWNPESDSYNGLYNGGAPGAGTPWFHDNPEPGVGIGVVFDGTSAVNIGTSLVIPGDPTYASPNHVPAQVQTQYNNAEDNTIFNGEEVKLRFYFRNALDFSIFGGTAPYIRKINIQLYDGDTALSDSVLLDATSTTLTDTNYSTYHVTPTTSTYEVGYTTTAGFDFDELISDNNKLHQIYFKFTDGTENEGIVVQDLQVRISLVHGDTTPSQTGITAGSMSSLNIKKVFELTSAFEQTTTSTPDGNFVPSAPILAFATVTHIVPDWVLKDVSGTDLYEHVYTTEAKATYGFNFSDLTTTTLTQSGSGTTATYVFPTSGSVSNGVVVYDDGSGGANMYVDGTYTTDDVFLFDNEPDGVVVEQTLTVVENDWYFADLIYNNFFGVTNGGLITIDSLGSSNGTVFNLVNTNMYGTNTNVRRAIFQIDNEQETSNLIKVKIPSTSKIKIEKFKLIKINDVYTGGDVTDWVFNADPTPPEHSFDLPSIYGGANGIEFNVASGGGQRYFYQSLSSSLVSTYSGYKLEFDISNYASGSLDLYIKNDVEGITIEDVITADGNYSIDFNFDNNSYDLTNNGNIVGTTIPASTYWPWGLIDIIIFRGDVQNGFDGCVKNISLIDLTNYYTGASFDSFNITGYDQVLQSYIDLQNGQIVFTDSPILGASSEQIQISQLIEKDIKENDTYRLKFEYDFDPGSSIGVYYFSSIDNKGFKVENLTGTDTYNVLHTINQDWIADHLKDTLVFFVYTNNTSGTINSILLRQEFSLVQTSTISFSENVRGWVSKKSFIPDQGISISSEYFTTEKGRLYKHDVSSEPRNTFYGEHVDSTITAVLNESPSSVKIFNTLNYEGSQSKVIPGDPSVLRDGYTYNTLDTYNLSSEPGWSVEYIKTDKQEGSLDEFIEKEGKWFNHIKGLSTDIKTSDLSFQGLGIVKTIA